MFASIKFTNILDMLKFRIVTMKQIIKLITLPLLITLFGCKDKENQYEIDPTLKPYLESFLNEAKARGINLNPEEDGLIMKFSSLKAPTIGLCTYSNPILVEIDQAYWSETALYANREDLRENVVFHELGHGLLNRGHTNATLKNSEWRSIMCGGDTYMDRGWNINFCGYRKEYYLNELFNMRTELPDWSDITTFSGEKGTIYAKMDLTNEYQNTKNDITYTIKNGEYQILRHDNRNENLNIEILQSDLNEDFYFEVSFTCPIQDENEFAGISAGYTNKKGETAYHYIFVNHNQRYSDSRYYISNSECMGPFVELVKPRLKTSEYNHIALHKYQGELYFYVNNELIYRNDYEVNNTFDRFGLIVPKSTLFKANQIQLFSQNDKSVSTKSFSQQTILPFPTKVSTIDNRLISLKKGE